MSFKKVSILSFSTLYKDLDCCMRLMSYTDNDNKFYNASDTITYATIFVYQFKPLITIETYEDIMKSFYAQRHST